MSYRAFESIEVAAYTDFIKIIPSVEYYKKKHKMQLKLISTLVFASLVAALALPPPPDKRIPAPPLPKLTFLLLHIPPYLL